MTPPLFTIDGDVYEFTEDMQEAFLSEIDSDEDAWFVGRTLHQAFETETGDTRIEKTDVVKVLKTRPEGMLEQFEDLTLDPLWECENGVVVNEGGVSLQKCI